MHPYPKRASLEGLETEIFKLVSSSATPEQWKEWLRVPLEHAAARGNLELFNKLLGAGANGAAGWRGCRGRTLLDAAALGGNEDVVSGLLGAGAQPDVNVVSVSSGRSALFTATYCGHALVANRLVIAGADVNFTDPVRKWSVLHEAVWGGHEQLTNDLVRSGADLNTRYYYGCTPLHLVAARGHNGIVSNLLLRGADKDAVNEDGDTPLILAAEFTRPCVAETLLTAGADFSIRSNSTYSALDIAAKKGNVRVVQAILGQGAYVDDHDEVGFTALHVAGEFDQAGVVQALVEAGANIELKNFRGVTPFFHAARHSSREAMLALRRHGASVNVRDNSGDTALHKACCQKCAGLEAAVDLLLRWGADEDALNNDDQTPSARLDLPHGDTEKPASRDEIERTRVLLSRAPSDRAWRRRGWLIMLRSRAEKAREAISCDSRGYATDVRSSADIPREGKSCKVARREGTESGGDHVVGKLASIGVRVDGGDGGVLSGVVGLLVGLEVEGVFRTALSFL